MHMRDQSKTNPKNNNNNNKHEFCKVIHTWNSICRLSCTLYISNCVSYAEGFGLENEDFNARLHIRQNKNNPTNREVIIMLHYLEGDDGRIVEHLHSIFKVKRHGTPTPISTPLELEVPFLGELQQVLTQQGGFKSCRLVLFVDIFVKVKKSLVPTPPCQTHIPHDSIVYLCQYSYNLVFPHIKISLPYLDSVVEV